MTFYVIQRKLVLAGAGCGVVLQFLHSSATPANMAFLYCLLCPVIWLVRWECIRRK